MKGIHLKILMIGLIVSLFFSAVPVTAVKSAEASFDDSLTRGSRFTVSILGIPNSSYYVWVPHTSSMTGEPYDQPPFIADYQANVAQDPEGGPYPIGSYQYNNGGGQTIRDDIPPSTPEMPNTRYYALVTTDSRGQATVEFQTTVYTALRSYTVRVENPRSVDSDTLQVGLQVFSRRAPAVIGIDTPVPRATTVVPTTTPSPSSFTSSPTTILTTVATMHPETVPTSPPTPAPRKSPVPAGAGIFAFGVAYLMIRGRH